MSDGTGPIRSFRDLKVWQRAMDLVVEAYAIAATLPDHEKYALADQLRRAAVSVPSNIAEGHQRSGKGEFKYSLSVSRGSLGELETLLEVAIRVRYVTRERLRTAFGYADHVSRMLTNMRRNLPP